MAAIRKADLLVMSAYTHNRFIEAIFGSVTRDMMAQARITLLLTH